MAKGSPDGFLISHSAPSFRPGISLAHSEWQHFKFGVRDERPLPALDSTLLRSAVAELIKINWKQY